MPILCILCNNYNLVTSRLVAGFPPRRPWFELGSGHVEILVDKVALGQIFSEYFGFPCQSLFHQFLHNHHYLSSVADERVNLFLMNMLGFSWSVHPSFRTTHKSSVSIGFTEQILPILRILCFNGSLVISTVVILEFLYIAAAQNTNKIPLPLSELLRNLANIVAWPTETTTSIVAWLLENIYWVVAQQWS
jgi:hypothetical protein